MAFGQSSNHSIWGETSSCLHSENSNLYQFNPLHLEELKWVYSWCCGWVSQTNWCDFISCARLMFGTALFPRRSGRRIRKTRKYDIITTPAERVEMAPLNEENDDDDDSTLFDVKYRFVPFLNDWIRRSFCNRCSSYPTTKENLIFFCFYCPNKKQLRAQLLWERST